MSAQPPTEQPWHAAFPAPRNTARSISREEMLQWMREGKQAGKDYVLVDLRRNDHEVSAGRLYHWSCDCTCTDRNSGRNDQGFAEPARSELVLFSVDGV
jgi:hypothetical protein